MTAERLRDEIRRLSASTEASFERDSEHGEFYHVVGSLVGPTGTSLPVKLIWLRRVDGVFSLVTLVPEPRSGR